MKPCILLILDGLSVEPMSDTNYFYQAATPYLDHIAQTFPMGLLRAPATSGEGHKVMGNGLSAYLASLGKRQEKWFDPVQLPVATYFFNDKQQETYQGEVWRPFATSTKLLQAPSAALPGSEACFILVSCSLPGEALLPFGKSPVRGRAYQGKQALAMIEKIDTLVHTSIEVMLACGSTVLLTSSYAMAGSVPVFLIGKNFEGKRFTTSIEGPLITHDWSTVPVLGTLHDIAPTLLKLMGLEKPRDMQGSMLM